MENYYLFYSLSCPDSKKIIDKISKIEDTNITNNMKHFAIENGQYPQNLQTVPAILVDNGKTQELYQGPEAFQWVNGKAINAIRSENVGNVGFSFLSNSQQTSLVDRNSQTWNNDPQVQQHLNVNNTILQQNLDQGQPVGPSPQQRMMQGPSNYQEMPSGLQQPQPQSMKNNAEQRAQQEYDKLLAQRSAGIPQPPRRIG